MYKFFKCSTFEIVFVPYMTSQRADLLLLGNIGNEYFEYYWTLICVLCPPIRIVEDSCLPTETWRCCSAQQVIDSETIIKSGGAQAFSC